MPVVVWQIDRSLRFTLSEGGGLAALDGLPGHAVGRTLFEYFATEDRSFPPIRAHLRALEGAPGAFDIEWKDRWFHARVEPVREEDGRVGGVAGFAIDLSERRIADRELQAAETRYRTLVEQLPAVVYVGKCDPLGDWLYVSPQLESVLGYSPTEWLELAHPIATFTHPDDLPAVRVEAERSSRENDSFHAEYRVRASDGRWVWIQNDAVRIRDQAGVPVLFQGLMSDVTNRHEAEAALRRSEERFRTLVEAAPDAAIVVDEQGAIALANGRAVEMFGYDREELVGRPIEILVPDASRHAHVELRRGYPSRSPGCGMDTQGRPLGRRKDGGLFPVEVSLASIDTDDGAMAIAFVRDVTERQQIEDRLRRTNRALRMLRQASGALIGVSDEVTALQEVCDTMIDVGDYRLAWVGYAQSNAERTVRPVARAGVREYLDEARVTWADEPRGRGPVGSAIRTGSVVLTRRTGDDPTFAPWRELALRHGLGSALALPLRAGNETFGALTVYAAEADAFDEAEVELLRDFANDVAARIVAIRTRIERDEADAELRSTVKTLRAVDRQRRELLSRLFWAQEQERRTIAADIHDDTIQAVTAVALRLASLERSVGAPEQVDVIHRLQDSVEQAIARLRRLTFELRPPALEREGVAAALREYLPRIFDEAGIDFRLDGNLASEPPPDIQAVLYRIAHEALVNVRKHSGARSVTVALESDGDAVVLRVEDDGVGFDGGAIDALSGGHSGLRNMDERAAMCGGRLEVRPRARGGTIVTARIPLRRESAEVGPSVGGGPVVAATRAS
jgi:PAS domain S-box-containing protein